MNAFGKLLAFLNLFAGVTLLAWSVSIYANQVDWLDRKSDAGTTEGQITQMKKEIDRHTRSITATQASYGAEASEVARLEAARDYRKAGYAQRLTQARTGSFTVQLPQPPLGPNSNYTDLPGLHTFTDLKRSGPAILGADNRPLRGTKFLEDEFVRQVRQAEQLRKGDPNAPINIANVNQLGIDNLRMLQGLLSDQVNALDVAIGKQKDVQANLGEESEYLTDKRINWQADLQVLQRRQQQLENRLTRLGGK
jgi:hypothetical protein